MEIEIKNIPENANANCVGTDARDAGQNTVCQGCPNQGSCTGCSTQKYPTDANDGCIGTDSKDAGKVTGCDGCPNQTSCSSPKPAPENVPENANEHCPGTDSEQAGKNSSCNGCPNQTICASGELNKPDPAKADIAKKMASIKNKILVLSGKGGVGKSTVSSQLAMMLANKGYDVGLMDVDICGPSIPTMMGLKGQEVHQSAEGWSPVYVDENLGVMSIGFLLPEDDAAVIWRGPKKNALIQQFLTDICWGELDYLIIDTPPGTSDEHISIVQYLNMNEKDGAIIVTTPQEVALCDVRKEVNFCQKTSLPIIGVIENMSFFVCPKCENCSEIFKGGTGGAQGMCDKYGLELLGTIPIEPIIGQSCETGKSLAVEHPDAKSTAAFNSIVSKIEAKASK